MIVFFQEIEEKVVLLAVTKNFVFVDLNFPSCCIFFQIHKNGMTNTVCTIYELVNGDDTVNEG